VIDRCEDEIPLKWPMRQAAGRPKKSAVPPTPRIPRITRLMALAIRFQEMINRGEVKDYADLARLGFVTRARVTQIMNLTLLAPDIQESILGSNQSPNESAIRRVALIALWQDQRKTISSINPRRQPQRLAAPPSLAQEGRGIPLPL
jgi:hypothetical protein